jgi:RNA polymerase sigma-70 factor (ECF subfamily)
MDGGTNDCSRPKDSHPRLHKWWQSEQYLWNDYVTEVGEKLLRYLIAKVGNKADAEDCLQEIFIRFFKYIDNFDADRPLLPWLMAITRNVAINFLRDEAKRTHEVITQSVTSDHSNRDDHLDRIIFQETIDKLIEDSNLTKRQAAIFVLCVYGDLGPSDIADILNDVPKQVRQQLWKLRKKIRSNVDRSQLSD